MPTPPKALLLDVMSTLVYDPFAAEMPAFFEMSFREMLPLLNGDLWCAFERGEVTQEDFLDGFFKDGRDYDQDAFCQTVRGAYRLLPGIEALLTELGDHGVTMVALSNYPVWYRWIEERLRLSRFLDWGFVSCQTGVRKPAPAAYTGVASGLGLDPAACLFVDDRESNCAAAREVGMDAVRYVSTPQLRSALAERGLLG